MVDVVQSPQKERESNSNMQWKMTDQGQGGDRKIERSYQIIIKCYVTRKKEREVTQICSGNDGSRSRR